MAPVPLSRKTLDRWSAASRAADTSVPIHGEVLGRDALTSLYLVGAGGVGREVLDTALAASNVVTAFLDDRATGTTVRELPVLAPGEAPAGAHFVIAIAEPRARRSLAAQLEQLGLTPMSLNHPRATVAPLTELGDGNIVHTSTYISTSVHTGGHCQVRYNATVGHETVLHDSISVLPGANIGWAARLGAGSTVGSDATVL